MKLLDNKNEKCSVKLFSLDKETKGYKNAIVSYKPDGVDFLSASVFVWLTNHNDIRRPQKEIYFHCGEDTYEHESVLKTALDEL